MHALFCPLRGALQSCVQNFGVNFLVGDRYLSLEVSEFRGTKDVQVKAPRGTRNKALRGPWVRLASPFG